MDTNRSLPSKDSEIICLPIEDQREALERLFKLSYGSYGCNSCVIAIRNDNGDYIASTSTCKRILQLMSFPEPLLKVICVGVDQHVQNYLDGGLFTINLCLSLVTKATELNIHRKLVCNFLDMVFMKAIDLLQCSYFPAKININLSDTETLNKLISSVILPKSGCGLLGRDLNHLQEMVLDVFQCTKHVSLKDAEEVVHYLLTDGKEVQDSVVVEGVLFAEFSIDPDDVHWQTKFRNNGYDIRVVLVDISMAGDSEDFISVKFEGKINSREMTVLGKIQEFVACCKKMKIDLILCQKVIHPMLKRFLEAEKVNYLERLGKKTCLAVKRLAGCEVVSSFQTTLEKCHIGEVAQIAHRVFNQKSYVELSGGNNSTVYTVVLCHLTDELLQELMVVFQAAVHCLRIILRKPVALTGGGCWQTVLAACLAAEIKKNEHDWSSSLGCHKDILSLLIKFFVESLHFASHSKPKHCESVIDNEFCHQWNLPFDENEQSAIHCNCGAVKNQKHCKWLSGSEILALNMSPAIHCNDSQIEVLDAFVTAESALKTALSLAKTITSVHCVVMDNN